MGYIEAWELWTEGELTLAGLGDVLIEEGYEPREIREMLSAEINYPIPKNYFGDEDDQEHAADA